MSSDIAPLIVGILVFSASLLSLKLGLSVAIIEILLGVTAGYFGLKPEGWMIYLAGLGGILLTFLAGLEIDTRMMKERFKESFFIGSCSFLFPFIIVSLVAFYFIHWQLKASLLAGIVLSTTSIAVVYSVIVETGLSKTQIGKLLLASTFVTNMGSVLALSILFLKPTMYTLVFVAVSVLVIILASKYSYKIFGHPKLKNKVIEPEIKYIFLLLIIFMFFAKMGSGHAVLPAFLLGFLMSKHFSDTSEEKVVRNRLRTVAYAVITPVFFIVGGLYLSVPMVISSFGIFLLFFLLKIGTKFAGVYFFAKKYVPEGTMYTTLLMSTGLTFGNIASVFGLSSGIIDRMQYSILIGVVVASAVIPSFIAQRWFMPVEEEDLIETEEPVI